MDDEKSEIRRRSVRICLEPPYAMSGPMGTAIISRVPSFRVQRDDQDKSVFCTISRLGRHLATCGMTETGIQDAIAKLDALETPGDFIEVEIC